MRTLVVVAVVLVCPARLRAVRRVRRWIRQSNPSSLEGNYERVRKFIVGAADEMPPAEYAFKPSPEVRSFGQLIGHIADASYMFCGAAKKDAKAPWKNIEKTVTTKDALKKALADAFAYSRRGLRRVEGRGAVDADLALRQRQDAQVPGARHQRRARQRALRQHRDLPAHQEARSAVVVEHVALVPPPYFCLRGTRPCTNRKSPRPVDDSPRWPALRSKRWCDVARPTARRWVMRTIPLVGTCGACGSGDDGGGPTSTPSSVPPTPTQHRRRHRHRRRRRHRRR